MRVIGVILCGDPLQPRLPREPLGLPERVDGHEEHGRVEAEEDEDGEVEVELEAVGGEEAGAEANAGVDAGSCGNLQRISL